MLLQPEQAGDAGGNAAADLERRPLPSGAAAGEVGEHRAEEDQRGQPQGGALIAPDAGDDLIGADVVFHAPRLVAPHDDQARQGHTEQQPWMGAPQGRGLGHAPGERRPREAAGNPRQTRQPEPLRQRPEGGDDAAGAPAQYF